MPIFNFGFHHFSLRFIQLCFCNSGLYAFFLAKAQKRRNPESSGGKQDGGRAEEEGGAAEKRRGGTKAKGT